MSGPLAQHRTPVKPQFIKFGDNIIPVFKGLRRIVRPGGVFRNGRCVEWHITTEPRPAYVLDYSPQYHRPSKHARGRMRPRTGKERRRLAGVEARAVQASKSLSEDQKAYLIFRDELS